MQAMSLEDGPPEAPPAQAKRKHPRWLIMLEVLTVVAVVAPFIAYLIATNLGSSSTAGTAQVTVSNDGAATVTVQNCAPGCSSPEQVVLTPGSSTQVSVATGGTTYYLVDGTGALAGCLVLTHSEHSPAATSRAGTCPGHR